MAIREFGAAVTAVPDRAWETRYLRQVLAVDLMVGLGAGTVAFCLRFGEHLTSYNLRYFALSLLFPLAWVAALALNRAYEKRYLYVGTDEYQRVFRAGLGLTAGLAVFAYALDFPLARGYVIMVLPLATAATLLVRFLLRKALHYARARGRCLRRVVVVGHSSAVEQLATQLRREAYHGLRVVGACLPPGQYADGLPTCGDFGDVAAAVEAARADTVVVLSCPELDGIAMRRLAWELERGDVDLIVASSLLDVAGDRTTIRPVDGLPMLHVEHPNLAGTRRLAKELFDRVGALLILVMIAPLWLVISLAIWWAEPGAPVLFQQLRVGKHGKLFAVWKFRSMYVDAEARLAALNSDNSGVLFKMRNDPRVTPIGRWLRRFSLDELPQLVNVVCGHMSLVGPRPPLPAEVAAYPEDMRRRLVVKPGLTGLWQVSGRSDLPWEEAIRLDLQYVENWSLSLDLVILLRTLTAVCRASGAY
ncbi:sugar transferase [Longispora albida]|uniref:sugar transferase n=1 Tax=Longispora albida TaxID=203523 RepID=UPI00037F4A48|nr:sugar transferase [Longispora albida]